MTDPIADFMAEHPERVTICPTAYCLPTQAARSTEHADAKAIADMLLPGPDEHTKRSQQNGTRRGQLADRRKTLRDGKPKLRHGRGPGWSVEQDKQLMELADSGMAYGVIAVMLNRTHAACKARVFKLRNGLVG